MLVRGRIEEAVRYTEAGQAVISSDRGELPFGFEGLLGNPYMPSVSLNGRSSGAVPSWYAPAMRT